MRYADQRPVFGHARTASISRICLVPVPWVYASLVDLVHCFDFSDHSRGGGITAREERPPGSAGVSPAQRPPGTIGRNRRQAEERWHSRKNRRGSRRDRPMKPVQFLTEELKLSGGETASPLCAPSRPNRRRFADEGHGACWLKDARVRWSRMHCCILTVSGIGFWRRHYAQSRACGPRDTPGFLGRGNPLAFTAKRANRLWCQVGLESSGWEPISTAMFAMRPISGT